MGGFLTGLVISMALIPPMPVNNRNVKVYQRNMKFSGIAFSLIWFVLGFTLFYTVRHPSNFRVPINEENNGLWLF